MQYHQTAICLATGDLTPATTRAFSKNKLGEKMLQRQEMMGWKLRRTELCITAKRADPQGSKLWEPWGTRLPSEEISPRRPQRSQDCGSKPRRSESNRGWDGGLKRAGTQMRAYLQRKLPNSPFGYSEILKSPLTPVAMVCTDLHTLVACRPPPPPSARRSDRSCPDARVSGG